MRRFTACAYYTRNYREYYMEFLKGVQYHNQNHFDIEWDIYALNDLGNWLNNTAFKPFFIRNCMLKYPDRNILFVDIDAAIMGSLERFLHSTNDIEVYHRLNAPESPTDGERHTCTGVIFLHNNLRVFNFVNRWITETLVKSNGWEQSAFQRVLESTQDLDIGYLPQEYCNIVDGELRADETSSVVSIIEQRLASYTHAGTSGKIRDRNVCQNGGY